MWPTNERIDYLYFTQTIFIYEKYMFVRSLSVRDTEGQIKKLFIGNKQYIYDWKAVSSTAAVGWFKFIWIPTVP